MARTVLIALAAFASAAAGVAEATAQTPPKRPKVLMIVAVDLWFSDVNGHFNNLL